MFLQKAEGGPPSIPLVMPAAVRALLCPRPVVGRDATVDVREGRPPAMVVVATDIMAVPPRTDATGRRPPPVEGMRALTDAMVVVVGDS